MRQRTPTVCPLFRNVLEWMEPIRQDWTYMKHDFIVCTTPRSSLRYEFYFRVIMIALNAAKCLLASLLFDSPRRQFYRVDAAICKAIEGVIDELSMRAEIDIMRGHPVIHDFDQGLYDGIFSAFERSIVGRCRKGDTNPLMNLVFFAFENGTVFHDWLGGRNSNRG